MKLLQRNIFSYKFILIIFILLFISYEVFAMSNTVRTIQLPKPVLNKSAYLDQVLQERRSVRNFANKELTLEQISQLLWAGDGISDTAKELRTAPSAGALYPLDLYVVKKDGVWHYIVKNHSLQLMTPSDLRAALSIAALGQVSITRAPLDIVITAQYDRITAKYSEHSTKYAQLEAGHIAQNLALEAVALGLASVPIGAFNDENIKKILQLPTNHEPVYIIPIGYKKE